MYKFNIQKYRIANIVRFISFYYGVDDVRQTPNKNMNTF